MELKKHETTPKEKVKKGSIFKIAGVIGCILLVGTGAVFGAQRLKKQLSQNAANETQETQQEPSLPKTPTNSKNNTIVTDKITGSQPEESTITITPTELITNSEDAISQAEQAEPLPDPQEDTSAVSEYNYTGYLDEHPNYKNVLQQVDLDGDGTCERVYKEYHKKEQYSSMYLYFSSGIKLTLDEECWGQFYDIEFADLTGDGQLEIIYSQIAASTSGLPEGVWVYQNTKDGYQRMPLLYQQPDGMVTLPIQLTREDDYNVLLEQPDTSYKKLYKFDGLDEDYCAVDSIGHLWFADQDGQMINAMGEDMEIVPSDDKNKKNLQFTAYPGDKWCEKTITWELEYVDSSWIIKKVLAL